MNACFPVSTSDFKKIATEGFDFVDKSLMIRDLTGSDLRAFLFTRPRRFGKTMSLSMLEAFFDADNEDSCEMFSKLEISDEPEAMAHLGKYKVIRLDLSSTESDSMGQFMESFSSAISRSLGSFYKGISGCGSIPEEERKLFLSYCKMEATPDALTNSIADVCRWIRTAYGKDAVILIDEYDRPVFSAFLHGFYEELLDFYRGFMEATLGDGSDYRLAVVAGCPRISGKDIFGRIEGLETMDIFRTEFDGAFGFTESEIGSLIKRAGIPSEAIDDIRAYYGRFRFGEKEVYCPFDIANRLQDCISSRQKPIGYWAQSGSTALISDVLKHASSEFRDRILSLSSPGSSICLPVSPELDFRSLSSTNEEALEEAAVSLMVTSGYLKAIPRGDGTYELSLPGKEMLEAFEEIGKAADDSDRAA